MPLVCFIVTGEPSQLQVDYKVIQFNAALDMEYAGATNAPFLSMLPIEPAALLIVMNLARRDFLRSG